jgi:hypothetical protein
MVSGSISDIPKSDPRSGRPAFSRPGNGPHLGLGASDSARGLDAVVDRLGIGEQEAIVTGLMCHGTFC